VSLTAAQLIAAAEAAEAEAQRLELEAASVREYATSLRDSAAKASLTIGRDTGTVETQMHVESAGAKRSAGQFTPEQAKHGFVAMLIRRGLDVATVAARLEELLRRKVPRTTVQAWYKDAGDANFRAPPEDAVKALKAEYGVPLSAWPRVKSSPKQ
jgi:hypothetical protein